MLASGDASPFRRRIREGLCVTKAHRRSLLGRSRPEPDASPSTRKPTFGADRQGWDDPDAVELRNHEIEQERLELERGGRFSRLHWLVLSLSLTLTFVASFVTKHEVDARAETKFNQETDRSLALLHEQLRHYEGALWSGVAAIQANGGTMTDEQWKVYAETLDIVDKYPGAKGIGIIYSVGLDAADAFVAEQRRTRPDFEIYPAHDEVELLPITSIEPVETNRAAVGLDMAHETNRYNGLNMARKSGLAWMTGPIVLVQDEGQTAGFLFYAPWYDSNLEAPSDDPADDFVGAVYAPFVVNELVAGALVNSQRSVALSISDAGEVLFDENTADAEGFDPDPMFERRTDLQLFGRRWAVVTRTTLDFRAEAANNEPLIILLGGLTIDALLVVLFLGLTRSNRRAIRFADGLNSELIRNGARLEQSNIELERFAYVASHDLKTPLRGIGSLTEWIEEDLEDYFASEQSSPEVKTNLDRLKHQVDRMNSLIAGLLQYSRVGHSDDLEEREVDLAGHLRDLQLDLGLRDEQLTLKGDTVVTTTSATLFQQVVSNLITNAVQHHPDRDTALVTVEAVVRSSALELCVGDNGAGIAANQQKRIFEVFQTLGGESTGIGLSVVRKIVDHQQGSIRVESTLGAGATFVVLWPLDTEHGAISAQYQDLADDNREMSAV